MTIVLIAWGEYSGFADTVKAARHFARCPIIIEKHPKHGPLPKLIRVALEKKIKMLDPLSVARWIRLYEISRERKLSYPILTLDWDVIMFRDPEKAYIPFKGMDFCVSIDRGCGSSAYGINNPETLGEFHGLLESLVEKSDPALTNDMVCWHEYRCKYPNRKRGDMFQIHNQTVFDHNISCDGDGRFVMDGNAKLVVWKSGLPYFKLVSTGELILANWIHCWGPYKTKTAQLLKLAGI